MPSSGKRKGDKAEREVAAILNDHLGVSARRAFGAGRSLDEGDLVGVPMCAIQVVNWRDVTAAVRSKPLQAELQRVNAHQPFAATFVRLKASSSEPSPVYRVVQTVPQWCAMYRECL